VGKAPKRTVLDDLIKRGLRRPQFLIVDGAAGLEKAQRRRTRIAVEFARDCAFWILVGSRITVIIGSKAVADFIRPEVAYYRSLDKPAFNGNANAGIAPDWSWAVIAATDLIIHF
jgi:hypothetical protein